MKRCIILMLCIALSCGFVMTSLGNEINWEISSVHEKSELLPNDEIQSVSQLFGITRGKYLAESSIGLTNLGNSTLGIDVSTTSFYDCDRIRTKVFIDLYDKPNDDWIQVDQIEFDVYAEDMPDGKLHAFVKHVEISKPAGYHYRARGIHAVYKYDEDLVEGSSTRTDGVLLTSGDQ